MSWIKFILITIGSLAIVMVPGQIQAEPAQLKQLAEWESPPVVRVCYNTPIFKYKVEEALTFWKKLGYEFGTIIYDDTSEWCIGDTIPGAITIMPNQAYLGDGILALTRRYTFNKETIIGVRIEIASQGYGRELLLEHEFGHALGWPHYDVEGHIMYPILPRAGTNVSGLKVPE